MKITKTELLEKLQLVYKEAEKRTEEKQEASKGETADENDYVETDLLVEDGDLDSVASSIYELLDENSDNVIDNEELSKIKDILEGAGLNFGILLDYFEELGGEIADEVSEIKTSDMEDIDIEAFKVLLLNYPKLNELVEQVGYEEVFKLLDRNGNDTIEAEELEAIAKNDKNIDTLSEDDIKALLSANGYEMETNEIVDEANEKNLPEVRSENFSNSSSYPSVVSSSSGAPRFFKGYRSGGSSTRALASTSNNIGSMNNISELERLKEGQASELSKLNATLSNALNGEGEKLSALKEDMGKKEEVYQNLLSSEAKNNSAVASKRAELQKTESAIETCDENIKNSELELSELEGTISNKNSEISSLESERSALKASLSALNGTKVTDENRDTINAKRNELTKLISNKEAEISKAKDELKELDKQKAKLEKQISDLNNEKDELEQQRNALEEEIKALVSDETKNALEAYQDARDAFESEKAATISNTKSEIQSVQSKITEIDNRINELNALEIRKTHQINPYTMYNKERGETLANTAESLNGNKYKSGSRCASGVSEAMRIAFGYQPCKNGNNYWEALVGRDDWYEVTDTVQSVDDLRNLPAGAIVSWSEYNTDNLGRLYGHVYICDGKGNGISDFKETISDYYMSRNASWRVFIPV